MSNYGKQVLPLGMNEIQSARSLFPWGCWITCCFNCCLDDCGPSMLSWGPAFLPMLLQYWGSQFPGATFPMVTALPWLIAWVWIQGPRTVCCYCWDNLCLPSFILPPSNFLSLPPFAVIWMKASHQGNLGNVVLRLLAPLQNRKGHRRVNMKSRVKYQHSQLAIA